MVKLNVAPFHMAAFELTINLKAQVLKLQDLMGYLEDRHELDAKSMCAVRPRSTMC